MKTRVFKQEATKLGISVINYGGDKIAWTTGENPVAIAFLWQESPAEPVIGDHFATLLSVETQIAFQELLDEYSATPKSERN